MRPPPSRALGRCRLPVRVAGTVHHERWDGAGYPYGLAGRRIPFVARILAVADAFDAMTTTRPYRAAMPVEEALVEVGRCSGSQFDPAASRALLAAWDAGELPLYR